MVYLSSLSGSLSCNVLPQPCKSSFILVLVYRVCSKCSSIMSGGTVDSDKIVTGK